MRTARPVVPLALAILVGCSQPSRPPSTDCAEQPTTDCIQLHPSCREGRLVDESMIRAAVDGARVHVTLPVSSLGCGTSGTVKLRLIDIVAQPEAELGNDVESFSLPAAGTVVEASIAAKWAATPAPGELGRYVLAYELSGPFGVVRGRRSLFAAVPTVAATVLAPDAVPSSGKASVRISVRDPGSSAPIANASVEVALEEKDTSTTLWSGKTDADGAAVASFTAPAEAADGTNLVVRVTAQNGAATLKSPLRVTHDRRILLTSDKPLYQPGQTMHLRTLTLRRPQLVPEANAALVLEVQDGKGNKVARLHLVTDAFGVAATDFALASEVNTGSWTLRALVGDASVEKQVRVDRYSLPRYSVKISTDLDAAAPGSTVHGRVSAQYFFGKPVARAGVLVTASLGGNAFAQVSATTNDSGLATFDLAVPAAATGVVSLAASVTDAAGHPESSAASLPVAAGPLVVTILPEGGRAAVGLANRVYVAVTDPAGKPVRATVHATATGLDATATADAHGIAEVSWTPRAAGDSLLVEASNGGAKLEATLRAETAGAALVVRADRAVYKAGDVAHVEALVPAGVTAVAFDVVRDGETLASATAQAEGGRAKLELPIDAATRGALQIDASYGGASGLVRATQAIYVDPQNDLDVQVTLSDGSGAARTQYRPGEQAKVRLSVKGADGNPRAAALGVTVVDEAVFALGDAKQANAKVYFDLGGALSPSAAAAGFGAADLFAGDARDEAARLLFAANPAPAALPVRLESFPALLATAVAVIQPRVAFDRALIVSMLNAEARVGRLSQENVQINAPAIVAMTVDAFGSRYAGVFDPSSWSLTVTSAGFDERAGTLDDVVMSLPSWEYLWGGGCRGCGVTGEGDAFGGPPMAAGAEQKNATDLASGAGQGSAVHVRSWFPETLLSAPDVITGSDGTAELDVRIADSITTWRLAALASSADGALGSQTAAIPVFQAFFADAALPPTIQRGDSVVVPVSVHNYLTVPQQVVVAVQPASWFVLEGAASQAVSLAAGEVGAASFRLRATEVGTHAITFAASGSTLSDAVQRTIEVKPDGEPVATTASGRLDGPVQMSFSVPADAIPGATSLSVKIYPGVMSQAVEGLDSMLKLPGGCMEQTTSTAWPNVLVMDYLRRSNQTSPDLEKKALGYIQSGYQRILTFEKAGGGFGWWPDANEKPNRTVTAIGLMELYDTSKIIDVDPAVLTRSQQFLANAQQADGSWPSGDALHMGDEILAENPVRATAYIAWALARTGDRSGAVERALGFLRSKESSFSPYDLALAANAFLAHDPGAADAARLVASLEGAKTTDTKGVRWLLASPSWTGASGDIGAVEATGLATTAFLKAGAFPDSATSALTWLASKKDSVGNWYNTQATVNALRALIDSLSPTRTAVNARISLLVDGLPAGTVSVTPADSDLVRTIDLSARATAGAHTVAINFAGSGALFYQVVAQHYVAPAVAGGTLQLATAWSQTQVAIGGAPRVTAAITNTAKGTVDQAIVEAALPPGFTASSDELDALVKAGVASRWELGTNLVRFYLMGLRAGERRELSFSAQAGLAGALTAASSHAWLYYEPGVRASAAPVSFEITP